jgi:transcriptional regulator with XRE-family HTH domain
VRDSLGITTGELASRLFLSSDTIEQFEMGGAQLDVPTISMIADAMGVSPDSIDPWVRGDEVANQEAFARVARTRSLSWPQIHQLWELGSRRVVERYRGGIPESVWDELARTVSEQGKLFE